MRIKNIEGDDFLIRSVCICPICQKKFIKAINHAYKTENKKPICSYSCYMKYHRKLKQEFMEKHGDEFK